MIEENDKKKILIVEDDSFVMDIYETKLSQAGYDISGASNGLEALKKIEKDKFDLVLLDIIMPYMDGLEVLKKVKSDTKNKDLKVVLLTNLSQKEEVDKGLSLGASDYLIKSHFTPSEVLEKIKGYLEK